jgi:hypothetical protein
MNLLRAAAHKIASKNSNLVNTVSECLELLDTATSLLVGIVTGTDSTHACWFVPCVTLGAVVKVRVRTARAISVDIVNGTYQRNRRPSAHTQILPVMAICGQRWGLHMTATTAICENSQITVLFLSVLIHLLHWQF